MVITSLWMTQTICNTPCTRVIRCSECILDFCVRLLCSTAVCRMLLVLEIRRHAELCVVITCLNDIAMLE